MFFASKMVHFRGSLSEPLYNTNSYEEGHFLTPESGVISVVRYVFCSFCFLMCGSGESSETPLEFGVR